MVFVSVFFLEWLFWNYGESKAVYSDTQDSHLVNYYTYLFPVLQKKVNAICEHFKYAALNPSAKERVDRVVQSWTSYEFSGNSLAENEAFVRKVVNVLEECIQSDTCENRKELEGALLYKEIMRDLECLLLIVAFSLSPISISDSLLAIAVIVLLECVHGSTIYSIKRKISRNEQLVSEIDTVKLYCFVC